MANINSVLSAQTHLFKAALLLQDVAELDFQAGRFYEAKEMATASLQMNPACELAWEILMKIEMQLGMH